MAQEFDVLLRGAFPSVADVPVVRALASGVALADDARRNTSWLMSDIGDDLRGSLRRAAAMWRFEQDCRAGSLPFTARAVPNTTGSSHLLQISSGAFEAHIVRTSSEGAFPKDAPIRQDNRLTNQPDLFFDEKIIPISQARVDQYYAWLAFDADPLGALSHVCWCMPEASGRKYLSRVNILRAAPMSLDEHQPTAPDPTERMKFKKDVVEKLMDETPGPKQTRLEE